MRRIDTANDRKLFLETLLETVVVLGFPHPGFNRSASKIDRERRRKEGCRIPISYSYVRSPFTPACSTVGIVAAAALSKRFDFSLPSGAEDRTTGIQRMRKVWSGSLGADLEILKRSNLRCTLSTRCRQHLTLAKLTSNRSDPWRRSSAQFRVSARSIENTPMQRETFFAECFYYLIKKCGPC